MDVTDVAHQFSDPPRSLLLLPDTPIPELDEPLVNALQEHNYPLRSSNVAGDSRILRLMVDCTYNIGHILSL